MNEEMLRQILRDAQEKKQEGLFIWSNWNLWDKMGFGISSGNEHYEFALQEIREQREAIVTWSPFHMVVFMAVSVEKMLSDDSFFIQIFQQCKELKLGGPVTLIPLNQLSKVC